MGGPGASGVLVADRSLFRSRIPERPGGGTVDYVGPGAVGCPDCEPSAQATIRVDYATALSEREEGGTPDILGDIRAGLAFHLRTLLDPGRILEHELRLARMAVERLSAHPGIRLLGPRRGDRLPILSFNVDGLHHELASTLLDHLFGIQARAGCSCAGPYGHRLLSIDANSSERYRRLIQQGLLGAKPGWVRVSIPYYASPSDVEYLLASIEAVAEHGEAFVPLYRLSWRDGSWRPLLQPNSSEVLQLSDPTAWACSLHLLDAGVAPDEDALERERAGFLEDAATHAAALRARWRDSPPAWNRPTGNPEIDHLTWFKYVETDALPPRRVR